MNKTRLENIQKAMQEIALMVAEVARTESMQIEEAKFLDNCENRQENDYVLSILYKSKCHTKVFTDVDLEDFACFYPTTLRIREILRQWLESLKKEENS